MVPPKRIKPARILIAICTIAFVIGVLVVSSASFQIWYHTWQMNRAWNAQFNKPVSDNGLMGYELDERYPYHRQKLVQLGAIRELHYRLNHILVPSSEGGDFHKRLLSNHPPCIDFVADCPAVPEPAELTVWCYPGDADAWDQFIAKHDVPDYKARFIMQP